MWHRQIGIDLARPLADRVAAGPGSGTVKAEAVLDLTPGAVVVLDGGEWTVERREPHLGRVHLVSGGRRPAAGQPAVPGQPPGLLAVVADIGRGAGRGRQPRTPGDLTPGRRELAELRMAHLLEVATGFRGGDPLRPGPGEPKPEYDPARHDADPAPPGQGRRAEGA